MAVALETFRVAQPGGGGLEFPNLLIWPPEQRTMAEASRPAQDPPPQTAPPAENPQAVAIDPEVCAESRSRPCSLVGDVLTLLLSVC